MLFANRYEVAGTPFVGGMAEVIPCIDSILERKVAIKIMPESADQRRIQDELSALLKMRSKHVVQVYDVLRHNENDLAIVQEFIEGKDLYDKDVMPQTSTEYLKLIWQLASGIADIHDLNIIHRDIKPNNMKIDPEGVLKVFDFGLARDEGLGASTVGFVGTPGFAAPELYAMNANFAASVDTYAFGATALFLGMRDLPPELKQRPPVILETDYFRLTQFKLEDEVVSILNACLNFAPELRPTMASVRNILAKHLLCDLHKALIVFEGQASYLDANRRSVALRLPAMGEVEIQYDGFNFQVHSLSGDVFVNNRRVVVGDCLPGACVVALGAAEQRNKRKYITFDLSHPEIVL